MPIFRGTHNGDKQASIFAIENKQQQAIQGKQINEYMDKQEVSEGDRTKLSTDKA